MRKAFLEFLAAAGTIDPEQLVSVQNVLRVPPEPIGSIAFRHGMITGGDIDEILDEQRTNYRPFGEIAISKGVLTRRQMETLLGVQQLRAATETAGALALSGVAPIEQISTLLGRFLLQDQESLMSTHE